MDLSVKAGVAGSTLNILGSNVKYLFCCLRKQKFQLSGPRPPPSNVHALTLKCCLLYQWRTYTESWLVWWILAPTSFASIFWYRNKSLIIPCAHCRIVPISAKHFVCQELEIRSVVICHLCKTVFSKASGSYMKTLELLLCVDDLKLNFPMLLNPETSEKWCFLFFLLHPFLYN